MEKDENIKRLRRKAEELLNTRKAKAHLGTDTACRVSTDDDTQKLLHELEVHQVELEIQNEELRHAWAVAEVTNERYVELYDFAPSGHFSISFPGKIIGLNLNGAKMVGEERSRLINRRFASFLSAGTKPIFNRFLERVFISKAQESCEVTFQTGGHLPMHVQLTGLVTGETEKCHLTAVDITDRKKAEEALSESELRFRTLANSGQALIWTATVDKKCDYFNQVWLDFTGRTLEQELGDGWTEGIHPDDFDRCFTIYSASFDQRKPFSMDYRLRYHDGTYHWLQDDGKPRFDSHGNFTGYIGHCLDITDRKKAEDLIEKQLQYTKALNDIAEVIISDNNATEILENANRIVGETMQLDRALILDVSFRKNKITGLCEWLRMDHPDIAATNGERPLQSFINPFTEVYNTRKYIESHYNEVNKHFLADGSGDILHRQLHIKSLIWYPFSFYEDGFYVFTLNQILVQRQWTQEETGFLESVAKQVSLALIKIKLLDEQKNAQKELAKSEMRFRQVVEQSQEVVWEVDANGLYTYVSPISLAIYGYLPEQMIGKMYFFDLHPEAGRKKFKEAAFDIFHRKEGFYKLVNQIVKPDGRLAVLTTNGIPMMDENGNLTGYRGSDADITQTKLAEQEILNLNKNLEKKIAERTEQLDLVIKGSNDAPWDWNLVTDHLFYSLKWWQQLGYSPEEIPADSSLWRKLTHADDVEHTNKIFEEAINSENDSYEAEFRLLHKNGHYVPVLSRGYITRDETGKPIRVSGTNMDLTERKRTEAEIIRSRDEANKANLAKSEFLSRMSHELRTPMNSILGFAQLLNMGELNPKQKKGIGHILTSGKHLLDLIDEVLDISRIESGKLSLMPEPVQLSSLIAEVMDTVLPMADSQHLKLELENSPSNQLFVMSDRKRLTQLLLNLLNNAVKYNKEGGAISVKTELLQRDVQGTALVRISVTDTGQGIAPDDIPKLFIPFERIGAEKTQTEGAGLGLVIVKKIVAAMEGSVGVESVVGEGSTFWIDLPVTGNQKSWQDQKEDNSKLTSRLIEANHEIAFQIEEKSKRAAELVIIKKEHSDEMKEILKTGSTGTAKTGTILYIEDNIQNAELVEEILEIHHPEIRLIIAMFGNQGIKLAINNLPDLILLDLGLPDLTGSDVLASLQANDQTKSIPVVVVTADATLQQIEKLMTAGAKDYLTKPLDIPMFLQVVDEWIGVKDLTTQPVYNT